MSSELDDPLSTATGDKLFLTEEEVRTFLRDGVLVVDNVFSSAQITEALSGLSRTLSYHGVDTSNLADSGHALRNLSSTNGSGGVLDIFYSGWKMDIATNPRLFHVTSQLWHYAYCQNGESLDDLDDENIFKWHPHGAFDCDRGFMYIDRIGYRLPTDMAQKLGSELNGNDAGSAGKRRAKPIQRSLTPHLDCCPDSFHSNRSKWRPIQCFVSLTDNLEQNTGGFEAAPGFHRDFHKWAKTRPPSSVIKKVNGSRIETSYPAPCVGEYTHIRPKEDREVLDRIQHIPVRAGSAVFWDNRVPHANSYRNDGSHPRSVVYCSFLPDVKLNREYISNQLLNWKSRRPPTDQWINLDLDDGETATIIDEPEEDRLYQFSELGRRLVGIDPW